MNSNALIFLDFDGTLHPVGARTERLFDSAELLGRLLAPYPPVRIVLSTSWVATYGFEQTRDFLPPGLIERVVGATRQSVRSKLTRYEEIAVYLAEHHPSNWAALDDCSEGWPTSQIEHLIRTPSTLGLACPQATQALSRRLNDWFT